jgi:EAL domain-containing protein (putative c-di-GMP-specific phosphodiesterase class I)
MKIIDQNDHSSQCGACKVEEQDLFPFTMAFQPIVDTEARTVFAFEALVRGPQGEGAYTVLSQVTQANRYAFDQNCRVKAITLAAHLGVAEMGAKLSVNFMPGAVYSPAACIQKTLEAAKNTGFPLDRLIFEITEDERVRDIGHLRGIVSEYKKHGFDLALDDFGAGYSGMNLLAELDLDIVKLDAQLIRDIHTKQKSEKIVRAMVQLCSELGIKLVAEAVETKDEYDTLLACGIRLMQGYMFAKPRFEGLPAVQWPDATA